MSHPDAAELDAFLAAALPAPDAERVGTHLDDCHECRAAVERLTAVPSDLAASLLVATGAGAPDGLPGGPRIAGYTEFQEIGRGGCGIVYRARDLATSAVVAVKVLRGGAFATAAERAGFLTEAQAAARLRHPNVVPVLAVGGHAAVPYYVMAYAPGGSLSDRLDGTPVAADAAARLIQTIARAVHFAHSAGVVHRDLKPGNVLLGDGPDSFAEPRVADFGMAKFGGAGGAPTPTQAVLGTPSYMAPEQAFGRSREVGPTADVYSLGAILYELLTGRPPFRGATPYETLLQVRGLPLVWPRALRPDAPHQLEAVCLKCLEKGPAERYQTAAALADDLGRYLTGRRVLARHPGPARRAARWARRNPLAAGLAAALAAVTVTAGLGLTALWTRAERQAARAEGSAGDARRAQIETRKALCVYAVTAGRMFRNPDGISAEEKANHVGSIARATEVLTAPTGDPDEESDAAYALLQLADGLFMMRRPDAAVAPIRRARAVLNRLAEAHPDRDRFVFRYSQACSQLAGTLAAAGDTTEYEELVREAIRAAGTVGARRPDNAGVQSALASYEYKLALHLVRTGDWDGAERRYAAAVAGAARLFERSPEDPILCLEYFAVSYARARLCHARDGDPGPLLDHARQQLRTFERCRALQAKPNWAPTLWGLVGSADTVVALDRAGRAGDAAEIMDGYLRAAAALDPADPTAALTKVHLLLTDGARSRASDPVRSRGAYHEALRVTERGRADKSWPAGAAPGTLALILATCPDPTVRDPRRAVAEARVAAADPAWGYVLGIALLEAGEPAEAKTVLEAHVRWAEHNGTPSDLPGPRTHLARALWHLGERDAAAAELRRAEVALGRLGLYDFSRLDDRDRAWKLIEGLPPPPPWQRSSAGRAAP